MQFYFTRENKTPRKLVPLRYFFCRCYETVFDVFFHFVILGWYHQPPEAYTAWSSCEHLFGAACTSVQLEIENQILEYLNT